jgi:hypothetical protein
MAAGSKAHRNDGATGRTDDGRRGLRPGVREVSRGGKGRRQRSSSAREKEKGGGGEELTAWGWAVVFKGGRRGGREKRGVGPSSRQGQGPDGSGSRSTTHEAGEVCGEANGWARPESGPRLSMKEREREKSVTGGPPGQSNQIQNISNSFKLDLIRTGSP